MNFPSIVPSLLSEGAGGTGSLLMGSLDGRALGSWILIFFPFVLPP